MQELILPDIPYVILTFDDVYAGNKRVVLPIIERLKIPITVFVSTKAIENQEPYWYDMVIGKLEENTKNTISLDLDRFGLGVRAFKKNLLGENRWNKIQQLLTDLKKKLSKERNEIVEYILEQTAQMSNSSKQMLMPMTVADIKEMASSEFVTFGAHSHTHDILPQQDFKTALQNIITSKELLTTWTGQTIDFFAYPNGDFDNNTISAVTQAGFVSATTTHGRPWSLINSALEVPRIGIGRFDSLAIFKLKVSGILSE
jgi:peptidoglycan/xylan/chitin deacetylase (PgdA/CDA1 family)